MLVRGAVSEPVHPRRQCSHDVIIIVLTRSKCAGFLSVPGAGGFRRSKLRLNRPQKIDGNVRIRFEGAGRARFRLQHASGRDEPDESTWADVTAVSDARYEPTSMIGNDSLVCGVSVDVVNGNAEVEYRRHAAKLIRATLSWKRRWIDAGLQNYHGTRPMSPIVAIVADEPVRYSMDNGVTLSEFEPGEFYNVPGMNVARGMIAQLGEDCELVSSSCRTRIHSTRPRHRSRQSRRRRSRSRRSQRCKSRSRTTKRTATTRMIVVQTREPRGRN